MVNIIPAHICSSYFFILILIILLICSFINVYIVLLFFCVALYQH